MARILITEDKSFFASALANILQAEGHSFVCTDSTKAARDILENEDFDCVICDAKMSAYSGLEFALWLRRDKPTPLIVMAGFSDQVDAKAPFGLAGTTLLVKPFSQIDVRQALAATVPAERLTDLESHVQEALVQVPRGALKKSGLAEMSLFHYVEGRPQKVVDRGEEITAEKLAKSGEARLYTDRESLNAVMSSSLAAAKGVENPRVDPRKRTVLMQNAVQIINEQMSVMGIDQQSGEAAVEMLTTYLKTVDDNGVWDMIAGLDTFSRPIYAQTLATTVLCLLVAHEYEYSTQDCFRLATAALFHDVGYMGLEERLLNTPRPLLSVKDRAALDRHVEMGVAILQKSGWVSPEICDIVWQHHESMLGNGFPRALRGANIHPLARLLRLADEFCVLVMKTGGHLGVPPVKAVALLTENRALDQKLVLSLKRILSRSKQNV